MIKYAQMQILSRLKYASVHIFVSFDIVKSFNDVINYINKRLIERGRLVLC